GSARRRTISASRRTTEDSSHRPCRGFARPSLGSRQKPCLGADVPARGFWPRLASPAPAQDLDAADKAFQAEEEVGVVDGVGRRRGGALEQARAAQALTFGYRSRSISRPSARP